MAIHTTSFDFYSDYSNDNFSDYYEESYRTKHFLEELDALDNRSALSEYDEYELRELEESGILDGCNYEDDDPEFDDISFDRCVGFDSYGLL